MGSLDGKVAFITGVARGQGRSHAVRLAADGAAIIGVDICADIPSNGYPMASREELDETVALVEAEGGKMVASVADVRDFHALKAALDAGVEHFGRLDIVLANAGIAAMAFREVTDDEDLEMWTDVLNVNLVGAYHTAKAAIPHLIAGGQGGAIVFTSSTAGLRGFGGLQGGGLGYAASKHGIVGLMRTLANALAPLNIRVNTVHPTAVNTMMAVNPADGFVPGELSRGRPAPAESDAGRASRARGHQRRDRLPGFRRGEVRHRRHVPRRCRLLQQAMSGNESRCAAEWPANGF